MKPSIFKRTHSWTRSHKKSSLLLVLIAIIAAYIVYRNTTSSATTVTYFLEPAIRDSLITTVTGTGQVSAENQADIKSKVSGNITSLVVASGQDVKSGALLASIDARDAEIALENERINYAKLVKEADSATLTQSKNSLLDAVQSNKEAVDTLAKSYDSGFNSVSNAFLDLPEIDIGLNDLVNSSTGYLRDDKVIYLGDTARTLKNKASASYFAAKRSYDSTFSLYKSLTRASASSSVEKLILSTYDTVKLMASAVKDAKNVVDEVRADQPNFERTAAQTALDNISGWTSKTNSDLVDLLSVRNSIENAQTTIESSARDITAKQQSLDKILSGADPLDIQSAELSLRQKQYAYQDYFIRAPFDGTVAKLNVSKTDTVTSGQVIATLISKRRMAQITLNEVDIAKVKVGQKVTLSLDALPDLTITGTVSEVDLVGTVTQGVVTYTVKIAFDTDSDSIKPGMSVNASIITAIKADVLSVSNSAVKSQGNSYYVEVFPTKYSEAQASQGIPSDVKPTQKEVAVGASNDSITEITSGLNEGDQVVVRSAATKATAARSTSPNLFQATGATRSGGGAGNVNRLTR